MFYLIGSAINISILFSLKEYFSYYSLIKLMYINYNIIQRIF